MATHLLRFLVTSALAVCFMSTMSSLALAETDSVKVYQATVEGMT